MRLSHWIGFALLIVGLRAGGPSSFGGDSPAESALNTKGLTKAGRVLVIDAEKPVLARMKDVKGAFSSYAMLAEKQAAFERSEAQAAQLEERRVELKTNLDDLNQRIIEQATTPAGASNGPSRTGPGNGPTGGASPVSPLILQRDQVKEALAEVTMNQKVLKAEAPVVKDKKALDEEVKQKQESFKSSLAELRAMVDEVMKKYADLGADESVKKAVADLEKAAKTKLKLGPSDAFVAASKELDQAERRFLGKKPVAAAKKKTKSRTLTKK